MVTGLKSGIVSGLAAGILLAGVNAHAAGTESVVAGWYASAFFVTLVLLVGSVAGFGWALSRLRRKHAARLRSLASIDPLTQTPDRRTLLEALRREIDRSERYGRNLSILRMDVDDLSRLNDAHGEEVGDQVLLQCAEIARDVLRSSDIMGRFSGGEFVALLPETSREAARQAADRLLSAWRSVHLHTADGDVAFTVSVGVAAVRQGNDANTPEALLYRAETALQKAKAEGGDRVSDPDGEPGAT